MILFGEYLSNKSINKAEISRETGLSKIILGGLTRKEFSVLIAKKMTSIALAIDVEPKEIQKKLQVYNFVNVIW